MALAVLNTALEWVTMALSARAVVCGTYVGAHLFVEVLLLLVGLLLLSRKSSKPRKRKLKPKEIDDLCDQWVPEPLFPPITKEMLYEPPVLESAAGPHAIINGREIINFASANYLGLIGHEKLLETCTAAIEKYGVGSSSSRGFYGTFDVHLDFEAKVSKFLGTADAILYSYGLCAMFSAIPAFSRKGDIVVVDEGVHWGIQNGLCLSKSTVVYFKHNDMDSLRQTLENITKKHKRDKKMRRYIVVEAIYQNSGQIAPLDEIIRLKEKHRFRVLLDESNSFGVLGSSGKGLTEYFGIQAEKVDIIAAAMGHALATEGGFCAGIAGTEIHQRLTGAGYAFSASLPPYLASGATKALEILEENTNLVTKLKHNIAQLWEEVSDIPGLTPTNSAESPIIYLKLEKSTGSIENDRRLLENIAQRVLEEDGVLVVASKRSKVDGCRLPLGIKLFVSASHSESDLRKAAGSLKRVGASVLSGRN
ncbi:long chain base biosynthesis protein 1-like [Prosopis cineraria]|uniref:long chain base biosynthesis protein 1-like n=1 Tax=Prosopis cineraria TaxID=364024 RepID=UPI0024104954|nr:long chain base biosynthesis protein 1-like [Prosopis cineraria]XP_054798684.1 long chain base biosynthesis protein 1-like [Prosopis cineraria]